MVELGEKQEVILRINIVQHNQILVIGPFKYRVIRENDREWYLSNTEGANDAVFDFLGVRSRKNSWCTEQGVRPLRNGVFPYFCYGDIIKIINILMREVKLKEEKDAKKKGGDTSTRTQRQDRVEIPF